MVNTIERLWSTSVSALVASIPALMIGYTFAFPSSALLDLTEDRAGLPEDYRFSISFSEIFAALAPIGAIFGAPVSGFLADRWGRKMSLVFCGVPYLIGYLILSYAHYMSTAYGFKVLAITGRFLTGVGMGWAGSVGPVYIGEISSARFRGRFGSFTQIAVASGIVLNYGVSIKLSYFYSSLVAVGIIAVFECLVVCVYDTPSWLVRHGQRSRAVTALKWLRGPYVDVEEEIKEIESAESLNLWLVVKQLSKRYITVPIVIVMFSMFFHQIGGAHVLSTYAAVLYEEAGVPSPKKVALGTVGGVELAVTFISIFMIDAMGRKLLLFLSSVGMVVGSTLLGLHYYFTRPSLCSSVNNSTTTDSLSQSDSEFTNCINEHLAPLAITSTVLYAVAYSIGWGPVPWVILSELIPAHIRGVASGASTIVNWASAALVIGIYLTYAESVQYWFAWWTFAVLNIIALLFALIFIRETKGKTLESIELYYREHWC